VRLPRWQDPEGNIGSPAGPVDFFTNAGLKKAWAGGIDVRTIDWNGRRIRVATAPVGRERPPFRVGQAATELDGVEAVFQRQRSMLLLLIPVAMVVAALGGLFMANRALRPVEAMAAAAEKIGAEDLGQRLPAVGDDEMGQLARTFNGLIARLQESFGRQKHAYQKLETAFEAQRQFTADASHELRTPLSRMKLVSSAALSQNASPDEKDEALQIVDRTADDMSRLVQDLLDLARADAAALNLKLEPVDLHEAAEAAAEEFRLTGAAKIVVEGKGRAAADPRSLHRILRNLLANAVRHTPEYGLITLRVDGPTLTVQDTGEGIAPEHLPHLAERFYRGDADRSRASGGTGLGLAITKTLVEAQNGVMQIESTLGEGTKITLRFGH
jgi:signal transduction histidine kinase